LAALLAVLLAVLLCAQFLLPQDRPAVPDVPSMAARQTAPQVTLVAADPVLARRSMFRPNRRVSAGPDAAGMAIGPLGGAVPAGIVRVRGTARLVLQTPDGKSVTLRPGQSWQGWRLIGIGNDEVRFRQGGETITLGLGAANNNSYPGYTPPSYVLQGYNGGYQPNQADEQ